MWEESAKSKEHFPLIVRLVSHEVGSASGSHLTWISGYAIQRSTSSAEPCFRVLAHKRVSLGFKEIKREKKMAFVAGADGTLRSLGPSR